MLPSLRSPRSIRALVCLVVGLAGAGVAACETDHVLPGDYGPLDEGGASSPGRGDARAPPDGGEPTPTGDATVRQGEAGTPSSPRCDMSGRWLVAQRVLADAIGQKQASHNWFYYEVTQIGDDVLVTKGLHCGFEVVPITSLAATVDSQPVWPSILVHDSDTGRQGTMSATSSGCHLAIEKRYTVRGATMSFYSDPTQPMPTTSQQASGSTPGWEDWDMDGNPGITFTVSEGGSNIGDLYCSQRDWNQFDGAVGYEASTFKVPVTWGSEQDALGYSGSSLVTEPASPDTDASQHFAWFARLAPSQATGDDTAICAAVRSLVPTLTPGAMN
jgi:hypothetical protein